MQVAVWRVLVLPAVCAGAAVIAFAAGPDRVAFNRDIRPIMSDTCFRCHGPDKSSRKAGMRLDIREIATQPLKDGKIPIVPGDPDSSEIIHRIFAPTPERRMPPIMAHKVLTEKQKDTIRRWVAEGAVYEGHWAYQPIRRSPVPEISGSTAQIVNPIDNFIQERLRQGNLSPSLEADRRTLIRRVTLDLTGLLPNPKQVDEFERDRSPKAYEQLVDRLLASPAYAEQQTMHWLDDVRYADTCGFHGDNLVPAWPWRDYVLRSFRDNKPYSEFTREQLAGDLMPNATTEQRVASAYNRLNRTSAEGGVQPKEYLAKYGADRVRTVSAVWLGSTMGCAECHDHKFDPILTKDFYSMKAFFADIDETGLMPDLGEKAWGPKLALPSPEQERLRAMLIDRLANENRQIESKSPSSNFGPAQEHELVRRWQAGELAWKPQVPEAARSLNGATLTICGERVSGNSGVCAAPAGKPRLADLVVASGANPDNDTFEVTLHPGKGTWTELGLRAESDSSLVGNDIARGADRFVLTGVEAVLQAPGTHPHSLVFSLATAGRKKDSEASPALRYNGLPAMAVLDNDPQTGWGVSPGDSAQPFLALRFATPLATDADSRILVLLRHDSHQYRRAVIGRFRLALSSSEYSWPANGRKDEKDKDKSEPRIWADGLSDSVVATLQTNPDKRTDAQKTELRDYFLWSSRELTPDLARREIDEAQLNILDSSIPRVMTTVAVTPRVTRILPRANWMDETSPVVEPAIPELFGKLDTGGRRATRLDLANWLVSEKNPLTARAFVNRTWREFFGVGLSRVLDDLGSQGEWPTHPELIDWLASEFMHPQWQAEGTHDWDVKHLIRTIVLSHAYRQTSASNPDIDQKDPDNRLLARQSRFRVDAENVRDIALEVSGLLRPRFGGPSVKPYQPDGYLAALNFPKREYSASFGDDLYRRGLYTEWRRTFLHPSLLAFDAPTREECTVNRTNSNTPLQALVLLNDPIYVEAARVFAERTLDDGGRGFDKRLGWAFEWALGRAPSTQERKILSDLYESNLQRFRAEPEQAREFVTTGDSPLLVHKDLPQLAAMTTVTRAILNLHETITRN